MLPPLLQQYRPGFHPVVPFDPAKDRLLLLNFTETNTALTAPVVEDTVLFSAYVSEQLATANARYGIGGYNEHRTVYSRSKVFDAPAGEEPRRLHLGIDIWGQAGTAVYALMDGQVHSFAFNDRFGDYGATIILQHRLDDHVFHTLYGHLSVRDLDGLTGGKHIRSGDLIAHFGEPTENGHWPPHLHFQLIAAMGENKGDYPGVCKFSERQRYLSNCPDPDLVLDMLRFAFPAKQS